MIRGILTTVLVLSFCGGGTAVAQTCTTYPFNLTNGTTADASQVMANFNYVLNCANNQAAASILRGWLGGLTMSNDGTNPNPVVDTAAGVANADDATTLMTLPAFTKNANAAWVAGTGNGCLASGSSLAANTWYHLFVIARTDTGVVDELCSTSATAPPLPTNYTKKRRIGSFKTDGAAHILAFSQLGDEFIWATPVTDVNVTTLGTTPVTYTLASVPSCVQVNALVRAFMYKPQSRLTDSSFPRETGQRHPIPLPATSCSIPLPTLGARAHSLCEPPPPNRSKPSQARLRRHSCSPPTGGSIPAAGSTDFMSPTAERHHEFPAPAFRHLGEPHRAHDGMESPALVRHHWMGMGIKQSTKMVKAMPAITWL